MSFRGRKSDDWRVPGMKEAVITEGFFMSARLARRADPAELGKVVFVPTWYACPVVSVPVAGVAVCVLCFTASSFLPLPSLQEWCCLAGPVSARPCCQPCLWSCVWTACELRAAPCPPVSLLLLQPEMAALPFWSPSKLSCACSVLILALPSFGTVELSFQVRLAFVA